MADPRIDSDTTRSDAATTQFRGKYLSITSYRRDGTPVATPVWFVEHDGRLLVQTYARSGKVKRIRRDPVVSIAVCTATGKLRGKQVRAVAELLPDAEAGEAEKLIGRKYRADLMIIGPLRFIQSALHPRRPKAKSVILAITPPVPAVPPGLAERGK
jgi:uncharacterized protein